MGKHSVKRVKITLIISPKHKEKNFFQTLQRLLSPFADDAYFQRDLGSAKQNIQERELKLFLGALPKMQKNTCRSATLISSSAGAQRLSTLRHWGHHYDFVSPYQRVETTKTKRCNFS